MLKNHIPNVLTCANLFCGLLGIIQALNGQLAHAAYLVFLGALFDFSDGFTARWLNAYSPMGKDLDSLADMVTFGTVPALILYKIFGYYAINAYLPNLALALPIFSALRLAKFNHDTRQTTDFYGLPTPANALFWVSMALIAQNDTSTLARLILDWKTLAVLVPVFCFLMVADVKLFSLKFKKLKWQDNKYPLILIIIANALFFTLFYTGIPFIIILYVILSIIKNQTEK